MTTTTTEPTAVSDVTQRSRARFGTPNGSTGFGKRPRPVQKQPIEEDTVQKESVGLVNAEKPPTSGRGRYRSTTKLNGSTAITTTVSPSNGNNVGTTRLPFSKININRRRGRPTTSLPSSTTNSAGDDSEELAHSEIASSTTNVQSNSDPTTGAKSPNVRNRLQPGNLAVRPGLLRPGAGRINLRQKPGQPLVAVTSTTTVAPSESAEDIPEEPAGEGTEDETHEVGS